MNKLLAAFLLLSVGSLYGGYQGFHVITHDSCKQAFISHDISREKSYFMQAQEWYARISGAALSSFSDIKEPRAEATFDGGYQYMRLETKQNFSYKQAITDAITRFTNVCSGQKLLVIDMRSQDARTHIIPPHVHAQVEYIRLRHSKDVYITDLRDQALYLQDLRRTIKKAVNRLQPACVLYVSDYAHNGYVDSAKDVRVLQDEVIFKEVQLAGKPIMMISQSYNKLAGNAISKHVYFALQKQCKRFAKKSTGGFFFSRGKSITAGQLILTGISFLFGATATTLLLQLSFDALICIFFPLSVIALASDSCIGTGYLAGSILTLFNSVGLFVGFADFVVGLLGGFIGLSVLGLIILVPIFPVLAFVSLFVSNDSGLGLFWFLPWYRPYYGPKNFMKFSVTV